MKHRLFFVLALVFLLPAFANAQEATGDVRVILIDDAGEITTEFHPFGEDYRGTASITTGDLGGDGVPEIIVGAGPGLDPEVHLYRQDGSLISSFLAYDAEFQGGVTVAVCDVDGNGSTEIVTGTMVTGGPHVRIFNTEGVPLYGGGFFAYAADFRGGVNVACGDVNGDGTDEVVTGAGITGGPHVKVFEPDGSMTHEIFSGSAGENTGVTVAVGDLDGDGDVEIIAGRMGAGDPTVMAFDDRSGKLSFIIALSAFDDYTNGIQVTSGDVDGDGMDEIGVSTRRHATGVVKFFETTGATAALATPFSEGEKGVTATTIENGGNDHILAITSTARETDDVGKYILVDVSEQRLYAYENGAVVNSFLVSTGTYAFPTPYGKTEVMAKLLWHDYIWSYGPGNPNNYAIPDVKFNLRFRRHYYIHSAYWHNNFGNRMSHGCVNVHIDNAEWVYNWADVGTPVEIAP